MEQSYKEKYEQAIEKLRNFYRDYDTVSCLIDVKEELANLFPELAESEDEKIRKRLITDFGTIGKKEWGGLEVKDILAWLERQGDYANFRDKAQVGDRITKNEDGVLVNLSQIKRVAKPREKQCKQKSADEIEEAMQEVEEKAKVFSESHKGENSEQILAEMRGEQKPLRMVSAKAKEAMYDKPADTVEPKFKVGDKIYLKPEYRMPNDDTPIANTVKEIRRIDDKHYRFDGSYIFIEDQDKYELVEQDSAWSEEDEEHIDSLLKRLDALCRNKFERTRFAISEDRDWLKSLRPQSKQEWSEEDKYMYDILCGTIENTDINENTKYKLISWLKSLRPQNKRKQSDEQMEALDWQVETHQ